MRAAVVFFVLAITVFFGFAWLGPSSQKAMSPAAKSKQIARGRYLVTASACNDCHSPKLFTPEGPMPDTTKILSGHPANARLPELPKGVIGPDAWGAVGSNDFTAWSGPWGTSFARNLTPDKATGLGTWTEKMFIKAIRTGKDMGEGRAILPPMPWPEIRNYTDDDLKAIFAYLQSLPAVENAVPDPIPPAGAPPAPPKQ